MAKKKESTPVQLELFSPIHFMTVEPQVESIVQEAESHINNATTMCRYGVFHPSTVFSRLVESGDTSGQYQQWNLAGVDAMVTPKRLRSFQDNLTCVGCGRIGNVFFVERHVNDRQMQYLNLYCVDKSGIMLMTVDHILPDSLGGKYSPYNFQTMCRGCNQQKQNMMSLAEINLVRSDIDRFAKSWISRDYVHALLNLQELILTSKGTAQHPKFVAIFDKYRKKVKHGMKPTAVAGIVHNIQQEVEHVLLGAPIPGPKLQTIPPHIKMPWYAGIKRWWRSVKSRVRVFTIRYC